MVNNNTAPLCVCVTACFLINTEVSKEGLGIYSSYANEGGWERRYCGKPTLWYSTCILNDMLYCPVHMYRMTRIGGRDISNVKHSDTCHQSVRTKCLKMWQLS